MRNLDVFAVTQIQDNPMQINWIVHHKHKGQNDSVKNILKSNTYNFPLLAEEGVALHRVVGVGRDEVEHVVVRGVSRAVRYPEYGGVKIFGDVKKYL